MEIHRFEKVWLGVALVLIVGLIATVTYGALGAGVAMVDDSGGTVDSDAVTESPNFREPGLYETGEDEYAVYVVARRFSFQPGTSSPIRLPAGSRVTFYVTSADVVHGFELAGTNVNTMAIPGQVAKITVEFDDPGEYDIVCHEYCGSAHHTMVGDVTVVPQSEYQGESQ
jgi:cytochrome c oxidase subunit 2